MITGVSEVMRVLVIEYSAVSVVGANWKKYRAGRGRRDPCYYRKYHSGLAVLDPIG